ncbi:MAG: CNNM domain-containing protein [Kiritimatiellia bacterium]
MTIVLFLAAVLALCVSAFCSGAETGFLSVRRGRIIHMAREGGVRAKVIQEAIFHLGRTMTALLVGNNLANVSYSSAFTALVVASEISSPAAEAALSFLSALILLFFGEFLPKLFCAARPLRRLLALAPYWRWFARVFVPVGACVQLLIERLMPSCEPKLRVTPETVLKILKDRKDGVKLSDFENALIGRILVLRSQGRTVTPESLLSALDELPS